MDEAERLSRLQMNLRHHCPRAEVRGYTHADGLVIIQVDVLERLLALADDHEQDQRDRMMDRVFGGEDPW